MLRVKDQGETKEEPRNDLRTPKLKKVLLLRMPSLIPPLIPPIEHRLTTERIPREDLMRKKALFLRLSPKKVVLIPEKVKLAMNYKL